MLSEVASQIRQGIGSDFVCEDDSSLVEAAKTGDRLAFEILANRHGQKLLPSALRITGNREDAEDVVQQSLHKALVHIKEFEGRSSFSTWLMRIAMNEALMLRRRARPRRELSIDQSVGGREGAEFLEIADSNPDPERSYAQQERQGLLSSAMNRLRPGLRVVIEICYLNEKSVSEAARILGISVSAVKSRVHRSRKILRARFERQVNRKRPNSPLAVRRTNC